jgi:hypothetical protein
MIISEDLLEIIGVIGRLVTVPSEFLFPGELFRRTVRIGPAHVRNNDFIEENS